MKHLWLTPSRVCSILRRSAAYSVGLLPAASRSLHPADSPDADRLLHPVCLRRESREALVQHCWLTLPAQTARPCSRSTERMSLGHVPGSVWRCVDADSPPLLPIIRFIQWTLSPTRRATGLLPTASRFFHRAHTRAHTYAPTHKKYKHARAHTNKHTNASARARAHTHTHTHTGPGRWSRTRPTIPPADHDPRVTSPTTA